jgi:hypothetical protein
MPTPQDGSPRYNGGKSHIVGCWFIQRDPHGRPLATGKIARALRAGEYVLVYTSTQPGSFSQPTATIEQMTEFNFQLWAHEANWRRAHADALRQGVPDAQKEV